MRPSSRVWRPVELGFLTMLGVLAAHQLSDPDLWTHLAAGRWSLTHGTVMSTNQFSFVHADHPWHNVYWLYQLIVVGLWKMLGPAGVVGLKIVLALSLGALIVFGLRDSRQPVSGGEAVVLLLGGLLLLPRLTDRPEVVSYLCLVSLLILLRRSQWWACLPLQLVWANTHGFFPLGPAVAILYAASEWARGQRTTARRAAITAGGLLAGSTIAPSGWHNLLTFLEARGTLQTLSGAIEETISPFHPRLWSTDALVPVLLLFIGLILALFWWQRRRLTPFDWTLLVLLLPAALLVRRSVPLLVLAVLPGALRAARELRVDRLRWPVAVLLFAVAADFAIGGGRLVRFGENPRRFGFRIDETNLPAAAVTFIESEPAPDPRLLNIGFHTGGYLTWKLGAPGHVLIDGRMEAYPRGFVRDYLEWQTDLDRLADAARDERITHLVIVTDTPDSHALVDRVRQDPRWVKCFADATAVVFQPVDATLNSSTNAAR